MLRRRAFASAGCLLPVVACTPFAAGSEMPPGRDWPLHSTTIELPAKTDAAYAAVARAFGDDGDDTAYDIWPAGDGFVITGSTQSADGDHDLFVVQVDRHGEIEWAKVFGGAEIEIGFAVRTLADLSIVVAGWTHSFGAGAGDFYIVALDADGELRFQKTFGGAGEERATGITTTADGGFAVVGETYSFGGGDSRFFLVKADKTGRVEWQKSYDDGPLHERGLAILELDDGYLLAGNSMDSPSGSTATVSDGFVVRTDRRGGQRWIRRYGEDSHDIVHHVAPLDGGRFLLSGYTQGYGAKGENDLWLVTLDGDGSVLDNRVVGGEAADHNIMARRAADGAVDLAGYSRSYGAGDWDAHVLSLDPALEITRDAAFGGSGDDGAVSLYATEVASLAVVGYTQRPGRNDRDVLFFVIDE